MGLRVKKAAGFPYDDPEIISLSPQAFAHLVERMNNPRPPNDKMKALFAKKDK